jgi:hypothetical protein
MRARFLLLGAMLAGLAPGAWAQRAGQTEAPGAAAAPDLPSYARILEDAESKLRQAEEAASHAPVQQQAGAVSGERIELMRVARAAQDSVQRVPASFAGNEAYRNADRELRETLSSIVTAQRGGGEGSMQAAEKAAQIIAGLRQQVMQVAGTTGAPAPAQPALGTGR